MGEYGSLEYIMNSLAETDREFEAFVAEGNDPMNWTGYADWQYQEVFTLRDEILRLRAELERVTNG